MDEITRCGMKGQKTALRNPRIDNNGVRLAWETPRSKAAADIPQQKNSDRKRDYLVCLNSEQCRAVEYGVKPESAKNVGPLCAQLEAELARCKIPFRKYGGLKFIETAHVKDAISLLRWCENPADRVAGFRTLQLLPGIGPSTAAKILDRNSSRR